MDSKEPEKIKKIDYNYINSLNILIERKHPEIINEKLYIPISLDAKNIFYICIYNNYHNLESDSLKFIIESILSIESTKMREYPSFLPFLLPFDDEEINKINKFLICKQKMFFLNGLHGTGKHTFIRNHILYCYNESVDLYKIKDCEYGKITNLFIEGINIEILIVNELALLSEQDQKKILVDIISNNNKILFLCSAYDPLILSKKGVITPELETYCLKFRVRFPSLNRRINHLMENISFYFFCKGKPTSFFVSNEWLKNNQFAEGFDEIFKAFEKYHLPQPSINNIFENKGKIRDAVSTLEFNGIIYAKKIIGNSQNKIAKFLGISRGSLQHKLKKYQIPYTDWEE